MSWESLSFRPSPYPRIDLHAERRDARAMVLIRSRRMILCLVGIVFFSGSVLVPLSVNLVKANHRLSRLDRISAESEKQFKSMEVAQAAHEQQKAGWQRYTESRTRRQEWSRLLRALGSCVPREVCLESIQIGGADTQAQVTLQGSGETMEVLRLFLDALSGCPQVTQVRLVETAADTSLGPGSIRFKITARSHEDLLFAEQAVDTPESTTEKKSTDKNP